MQLRTIVSLFLLLLVCVALPADGVPSPVAGFAPAAADASGTPPQDLGSYISEGKAAVAAQNWTEAMVVTTKGLAWYPDDPELLCLQGYSYRKTGQYQKSVDIVSRAIPLDPRAVRYANRGYGYLALGNYTAALADAESGIAQDASYTANYGVKALALQGLGKNTEALAAISTAISQSPDSAHYWHVKGRILITIGDCDGARAALQKSLDIDPGYLLPYPSFGSAEQDLAALNAACAQKPSPATPAPTTTPLGPFGAVAGCLSAATILAFRK